MEAEGLLAGALDLLSPAVAIVGTRTPPDAAMRYTRWFSSVLARAGVTIISGGAFGIDAAAHQGALDVGGKTIAVLAGGLDDIYPEEHADLFETIKANGAIVSIDPRGHGIRKGSFFRRNVAIVTLADQVVVTCAPLRSGARNTATEARTRKVPLWVVPGAPWDEATEGGANECVFGDAARLIGPAPILAALKLKGTMEKSFLRWDENEDRRIEPLLGPSGFIPYVRRPRSGSSAPNRPLPASIPPGHPPPREWMETDESILPSGDERNVVEALQRGPLGIDELVLLTGLGVASLRGLLLTWTVTGVVREGPAGLFRLANH